MVKEKLIEAAAGYVTNSHFLFVSIISKSALQFFVLT